MAKSDAPNTKDRKPEEQEARFRVRLPGFVSDEDVGLGDAVQRATSTMGIKPCRGCGQRARALNSWLVFSGRRRY
jgi:hypothetical protein